MLGLVEIEDAARPSLRPIPTWVVFMFRNPTVFILGAGASWHYGYPTGEELVKKVLQKAQIAELYFKTSANITNIQRPNYIARDECENGPSTREMKEQWRK